MTIQEKKETILKIALAIDYISGQFYLIKDFVKLDFKRSLMRAIKYTNEITNEVEKHFKDSTHDQLSEDAILFTKIIDAFIESEEKGINHKFMNDFYRICKENNIKI